MAARPGRLVLAGMRPDTPAEIEFRLRRREIREQVLREVEARFGSVTPANAAAVIRWQSDRLRELEDAAWEEIRERHAKGRVR